MKSVLPILSLPVFIAFMLTVGEFYPFSNFPMYSDPDSGTVDYIFLGDADNMDSSGFPKPIAMQYGIGIRAAKGKKILYANAKELAKKLGKSREELSEEEWRKVARETLVYFRKRQDHMGTKDFLPERLALVHGELDLVPGEGISESLRVLAEEGSE